MKTNALVAIVTGCAALALFYGPAANAQFSSIRDLTELVDTLSELEEAEEETMEEDIEEMDAEMADTAPGVDAQLATQNCIQAGEEDKAAAMAMLFGDGAANKGLADDDISKYLVGLCVPDDFQAQFLLNQYLLGKGAYYSFYAERGLEDLAAYLEAAGVELGLKAEALKKDRSLRKQLRAENDLKKAAFMLNGEQPYSENAELFLEAIDQLEEEQRVEAIRLASLARGHALNATFFLSRALYVSKEMSATMVSNAGDELGTLARDAREASAASSNPFAAATSIASRLSFGKKQKASPTVQFASFAAENGKALVGTLTNVANVTRTLNTEAAEIPSLSQAELDEDANRLNEEWDLPDEFADEEAYADKNSLDS